MARRLLKMLLIVSTALTGSACVSSWKPPAPLKPRIESLRIEHRTDGTARRCLVHDGAWYQLTGSVLVVLDDTGREISRVDVSPPGSAGTALDLLAKGDDLYVLTGSGEIVTCDISSPWRPRVLRRQFVSGDVRGEALALTSHGVCVLGQGGVASLSRGRLVRLEPDHHVSSLVDHGGRLLYVDGRRIHRAADDAYLGSASMLQRSAPSRHVPPTSLLFARHERTGSLVGFMDEGCRELDATRLTAAVEGRVSRMRQRGGRLLVVTDEAIEVLHLTSQGLVPEWSIELEGVTDADWLDDGRLALAGSMGTGIATVGSREGLAAHVRTPGGLRHAASNGTELVAHSAHGTWRYPVGGAPVHEAHTGQTLPPPSRTAAMLDWSIQIDEAGAAVITTPHGDRSVDPPGGGRFHCVTATEDAFWLGHDTGIMVLLVGSTGTTTVADGAEAVVPAVRRLGVRIDGPVICLEPLMLGGGVAYASAHGGFGVVRESY